MSIQGNGVESLKDKLALSLKSDQEREAKLAALSDERHKVIVVHTFPTFRQKTPETYPGYSQYSIIYQKGDSFLLF